MDKVLLRIPKTGGSYVMRLFNGIMSENIKGYPNPSNAIEYNNNYIGAAQHLPSDTCGELWIPVRNPWDRIVSSYHHYLRDNEKISFTEFLEDDTTTDIHYKSMCYRLDRFNELLNYDNLVLFDVTSHNVDNESTVTTLIDTFLGLPMTENQKWIHGRYNESTERIGHYKEYYDEYSLQLVHDKYRDDFEMFVDVMGYDYENTVNDTFEPIRRIMD